MYNTAALTADPVLPGGDGVASVGRQVYAELQRRNPGLRLLQVRQQAAREEWNCRVRFRSPLPLATPAVSKSQGLKVETGQIRTKSLKSLGLPVVFNFDSSSIKLFISRPMMSVQV